MQLEQTNTLNQAMINLQSLSSAKRQEVFDFIDFLRNKQAHDVASTPLPDAIQQADNKNLDNFERWQQWHEKNKQFLDNDSSWADVRDKRDCGREFSWDD